MSNTDDQMSDSELLKHFGEKVQLKPKVLDGDNSIYKVSARIKNYARSGGLALTPVGEGLCNTFTHMILDLYRFAETLPETERKQLEVIIKRQEQMPGDFINMASKSQVSQK